MSSGCWPPVNSRHVVSTGCTTGISGTSSPHVLHRSQRTPPTPDGLLHAVTQCELVPICASRSSPKLPKSPPSSQERIHKQPQEAVCAPHTSLQRSVSARQHRRVSPGSAHSPAPSDPFLRTFITCCQQEQSGVYAGGGTAPLPQQNLAAPLHYHPNPDTWVLLHLPPEGCSRPTC